MMENKMESMEGNAPQETDDISVGVFLEIPRIIAEDLCRKDVENGAEILKYLFAEHIQDADFSSLIEYIRGELEDPNE